MDMEGPDFGRMDQLDKISKMPNVAAYAGVGDGTVADAVTALIGGKVVAEEQRDNLLLTIGDLRGLIAECLALNPTVSGDMEKVRLWSYVVSRMRQAALAKLEGKSDG